MARASNPFGRLNRASAGPPSPRAPLTRSPRAKRPLSKTQKGLLLGVSGIGGFVIANKMDGLVYHPMGRPVPAALLPALISGIGALALYKRHRDIAHAAATAGVGILIGILFKAIQRSGGKT